jgi:protocatechuate 3,4-dioxygenase beta subunit
MRLESTARITHRVRRARLPVFPVVLTLLLPVCLRLQAETIPLDGIVADEAGKPLAGATVELKPLLAEAEVVRLLLSGKDDLPAVASARTDASGHFLLQAPGPGMWIALASSPGKSTLQRELVPLLEPTSLGEARLPEDVEVKVRVVDPAGRPVARAFVQAFRGFRSHQYALAGRYDFGWSLPGTRSLTAPDGRLTLHRTPSTSLYLLASAPGFLSVKAEETDLVSPELRLEAGCPRAVLALDPEGKPVVGVILETGTAPLGLTDSAGALVVALPCTRRAALRWIAPDGRRGQERVEPAPALPSSQAVATSPERAPRLRITLPARPAYLAGKVLERNSRRPIPAAFVWAQGDPGGAVRSDASGAYLLPQPEPSVERLAAAADRATQERSSLVAPKRGGPPAAGKIAGPTFLLKPTGSLRGTVVDEQGGPVSGARVEVTWTAQDRESPTWTGDIQRTGADGTFHFRLEAGEAFGLRPVHPRRVGTDQAQTALKPGEQRAGVRLLLKPGRAAFGRVVDVHELPVAFATATLNAAVGAGDDTYWKGGLPDDDDTVSATTDAAGRFRFDKIPDPPLDLQIRAPGFAPLLVPRIEPAASEGAKATDLGTVVLREGATLQGVVVDPGGHPIEGASLRHRTEDLDRGRRWIQEMRQELPAVLSGPDGRFELRDLVSGRKVNVTARKKGYAEATLSGLSVPAERLLKVTLQPTFSIQGTVSDEEGQPVAGASVGLATTAPAWLERGRVLGTRYESYAVTDDEGRFELSVTTTGKLRIDAQAQGLKANGVDVEIREPRDLDGVEIVLHPGAVLFGRVLGPDGSGIDGARVALGHSERLSFLHRSTEATSTAEGEYRLEGLDEGKKQIDVQRSGFTSLEKVVEVEAGENRVDLRLERALSIEGRVLDPQGQPVASARVAAATENQEQGGATRKDGTFVIPDLAPGTYKVAADHSRFGPSEAVEVTLGGAPQRGVELRLTEGSTLRGRILGLTFEQLPGVVVQAMRRDGGDMSFKETAVDFQGQYRLGGLEPGEWNVSASFGTRSAEGKAAVPPGGGEAVLDLEFRAGLALTGRVTRAGKPLEGVNVVAQPQAGTASGYGPTDSRGAFRIEGLEAGTYTLHIVAFSSGLRHEQVVEVPAPAEVLIDLPSVALRGKVVDSQSRAPIAGVLLALTLESSGGMVGRFLPSVGVESDGEGGFGFAEMSPGRYRLIASKEGFTRAEVPIEVSEGGDVDGIAIELQRAQKQAVRIAATAGVPLPSEVDIALVDAASGAVVTQTRDRLDETGRAEIDALSGTWDLVVHAHGFATSSQPIVIPGSTPVALLSPPTDLVVSVPSLSGAQGGGILEVRDSGGRLFRTLSFQGRLDSSFPVRRGHASVTNLPAGTWSLTVTVPDGRALKGSATTQPGEPTVVTIGDEGAAPGR